MNTVSSKISGRQSSSLIIILNCGVCCKWTQGHTGKAGTASAEKKQGEANISTQGGLGANVEDTTHHLGVLR